VTETPTVIDSRTIAAFGPPKEHLIPAVHARPDPVKVGMLSFLLSEVAFFSTLILVFIWYLGETVRGEPRPSQVFEMPPVLIFTACLLSSSLTIHLAERGLHKDHRATFLLWWGLTILLGAAFLAGTAYEWYGLLNWINPATKLPDPLTISRNLFGTTYYTLVGFHAAHVTVGLILLTVIFGLVARSRLGAKSNGVTVVAWYWHFVDGVWVVVFTLVYLVARNMKP
jgi:cytochrome c oxidase subunit 3/cytochrome o ubiquinol oxidase subunit 3